MTTWALGEDGRLEEAHEKMASMHTMLQNSLSILSREEFSDLLNSKAVQEFGSQAAYPQDNLFPALDTKKFSIPESTVRHFFPRSKKDPIQISRRLMITKESIPAFLDWLTIVMAKSHRNAFTNYLVPNTLYLRSRETWSTRRPERGANEMVKKFSRTFQWAIVDSPTFKGTAKILLAVVVTWISSTTAPTCWGYWTYITREGTPMSFRRTVPIEEAEEVANNTYKMENAAMEKETRMRAFGPQGLYRNGNFTVRAECFNHLTLGQFVGLMVSAEFYPAHYSSAVLDTYVEMFIMRLVPPQIEEEGAAGTRMSTSREGTAPAAIAATI